MTAAIRKAVLLRLTPEVLERVDRARGAMNRTAWLTLVVTEYLGALEAADTVQQDTEYAVPPSVAADIAVLDATAPGESELEEEGYERDWTGETEEEEADEGLVF